MERKLTEAETKQLISLAQQGDEDALETLIICNSRLVRNIVRKMNKLPHEREDFEQIGMIGLVKAVKGFELSRNLKFSTYAVPTIKGEIGKFTRDKAGLLKVPRDLNMTANKIHYQKLYDLSPEDISEKLNLDNVQLAKDALELAKSPMESLDKADMFSSDKDEKVTLMDRLPSDINSEWFDMIAFRDAMSKLDDRERLVIRLRYDYELPQKEVGTIIGVSQMQVSRIEKRTLTKLKDLFLEMEFV
jgi:RNA polymerase sporulation-specific sigma factor